MENRLIVLDANIAVKLLHDEHDSEEAKNFLTECAVQDVRIIVPEHFLYELVNVSHRLNVKTELVYDFYESIKSSILMSVSPSRSMWLLAEKIANEGHIKSGFPSIYDSIYHALAIESEGVFVTADKRHFVKAQKFKHICLLETWQEVLK